jgi:rRNA maturation RNase YbeY
LKNTIKYHYLTDYELVNTKKYDFWLIELVAQEGKVIGDISFVYADDEYLKDLNLRYLNHDYYTDILTFDNSEGDLLTGDIFISIDRVKDNASQFGVTFENELLRVMAHGVLHMMGYNDKDDMDKVAMKAKEEYAIHMFHVEHKGGVT